MNSFLNVLSFCRRFVIVDKSTILRAALTENTSAYKGGVALTNNNESDNTERVD